MSSKRLSKTNCVALGCLLVSKLEHLGERIRSRQAKERFRADVGSERLSQRCQERRCATLPRLRRESNWILSCLSLIASSSGSTGDRACRAGRGGSRRRG